MVGSMISKHLVPNTKEFCAVLNLSHPIGRFECCVPNTSHRLRHCLASLLGHGRARAQFMKHEETIDFVDFFNRFGRGRGIPEDFGSQTMNRRSAGARPSWPGLEISRFLEPGRLGAGSELGFCSKPPDTGLQKIEFLGAQNREKYFL